MKISLIFAWFDLWIGAYWDKKKNWLYILPFPMIGIILKFKRAKGKNETLHDVSDMLPLEYDNLPEHLKQYIFNKHTHGDSVNESHIVYLEEDLLRIIAWMKEGNYR